MQRFYSDNLAEGIRLLYFQTDPSQYAKAVTLLEKAVADNEPDAYYVLARCYAWGDSGLPDSKQNDQKALELSQRGAELGSSLAILGADRFGKLKALQPFMNMSHEDAFAEALKIADSGNPLAMYAVGLVYYWGDIHRLPSHRLATPEANAAESLKWFDRAAEQGFIPALKNAYVSRRSGSNHVVKDVAGAIALLEKVQDHCAVPANLCSNIGNDYEKLGRKDKMFEWYMRGAEGGDAICMFNVAYSYEHGDGVAQDNNKAYEYYKMSAGAGYAPAADAAEKVKVKRPFWASLFKK
ncbi:MAG: sel1 repeat family protein [Clostridium sp.]|nr:sel1 repeat family protein [Acetatifactor muris]MCM1528167.1 sel1 repeat family protein [Bacteroides sp.]MCM1564105.1 sel1 repeat family protein [Clostridium sp.]